MLLRRLMLVVTLGAMTAQADPRVGSMDFATRAIKPQLGSLYAERFALYLRAQGIAVTTSKDIATVLSVERQKQLLGCAETSASCLTELIGALGVDALVTGFIAKVGKSTQVSVKVVDARTAATLFQWSKMVREEQVIDELEGAAPDAAAAIRKAFTEPPVAERPAAAPEPLPVTPPAQVSPPSVVLVQRPAGPIVLTSLGAAVVAAGAALLVASWAMVPSEVSSSVTPSVQAALATQAARFRLVGGIGAGVGAAALLGGLVWMARGPANAPSVSWAITRDGVALTVAGAW